MSNILKSVPVGKVILNEDTPQRIPRFEHYLIPYYQRGYRWDVNNVHALLTDVDSFIKSEEIKYCLQPIVVVPGADSNGHTIWEVVDGQQRLITMYIIFKYLQRPKYSILFEKRSKSTAFLENLSEDNYSNENPDFHFMSKAFIAVKEWFEKKTENDVGYIDDFNSHLTKKVEVIWYQIEELKQLKTEESSKKIEEEKINIFSRLNIGKIPLTDAELIRALLLSKIKYGLTERESIMRQSEISAEWYRIEMELRNDKFWYFLNNNRLEETSSAIELIFKLIASGSPKKYSTYLWFEKEIMQGSPELEKSRAEELWHKTKEYFHKFKYWFEKRILYHHIGFLLAKSENNGDMFRIILENSDQSKTAFASWVIKEVKKQVSHISLQNLSFENRSETLSTFLLYNILTADQCISAEKKRFPFDLYKKTEKDSSWSLEHIHAQRSEDMKDPKAIKKWLSDTLQVIEKIICIEKDSVSYSEENPNDIESAEIPEKIKDEMRAKMSLETFSAQDIREFNELRFKLVRLFDSGSLHVLDNLALLSVKDNATLNNAIFPVKRNRIIELKKEGKYIPETTLNVFLKYYSKSDLQPYYWSTSDKKDYIENIKETLSEYIN